MGKRNRKKNRVKWLTTTALSDNALVIGANGSRMVSKFSVKPWLQAMTANTEMPIFNSCYLKLVLNAQHASAQFARVEVCAVICADGSAFVDTDGHSSYTLEEDINTAAASFNVVHKFGNLDAMNLSFQPKNGADGLRTITGEPKVFNMMPIIAKMAKFVEDPAREPVFPECYIVFRGVGTVGVTYNVSGIFSFSNMIVPRTIPQDF